MSLRLLPTKGPRQVYEQVIRIWKAASQSGPPVCNGTSSCTGKPNHPLELELSLAAVFSASFLPSFHFFCNSSIP